MKSLLSPRDLLCWEIRMTVNHSTILGGNENRLFRATIMKDTWKIIKYRELLFYHLDLFRPCLSKPFPQLNCTRPMSGPEMNGVEAPSLAVLQPWPNLSRLPREK